MEKNAGIFWLGTPEALLRVVEERKGGVRLMTLYSAFSPAHTQEVHTRSLVRPKKQELIAAIQARPYAWSRRYPVESFFVPVWSEQGVKNRYAAVRIFSFSITENAGTAPARIFDQVENAVMSGGLARVADNMLWLGRYMERTEGMLRVIRSVLLRVHSETQLNKVSEMPFFLRAMANLKIISSDLGRLGAPNSQMAETLLNEIL